MNRYLSLIIHKDFLGLFGFLRDNPTRAYKNGSYYKFVYFEPLSYFLTPFKLNKLWLEISDTEPKAWELVRDNQIVYASDALLTELLDLEKHILTKQRQGTGLEFRGWLLDAVCYGIITKQDAALLVRLMFVAGYDYEQVIGVFSSLTKRFELSPYFLRELNRFYEGVSV